MSHVHDLQYFIYLALKYERDMAAFFQGHLPNN